MKGTIVNTIESIYGDKYIHADIKTNDGKIELYVIKKNGIEFKLGDKVVIENNKVSHAPKEEVIQ
jgi:hypothetical protein